MTELKPPRYHYLWAKTPTVIDSIEYLPLLFHLLDVGAVIRRLLEKEGPKLQELYRLDLALESIEAVLAWVPALGALHDIGKAFPTFQAKWPEYSRLLQPMNELKVDTWHTLRDFDIPHGVVSQAVLEALLPSKGLTKRLSQHIADAVGRHHGYPSEGKILNEALDRQEEDLDTSWVSTQTQIFEDVLNACGCHLYVPPKADEFEGGALMRLAGLVSFADWIGSNQAFFNTTRTPKSQPPSPACNLGHLSPGEVYENSLELASNALNAVDWPESVSTTQSFQQLFGFKPRGLQEVAIELSKDCHEPTLLIIEAPMGEGKTEAALFAHAQMQASRGSRGFYFALPTQATGNSMFRRIEHDFLARLGKSRVDLQLTHGAAVLNDDFERLKFACTVEDEEKDVVAREWFSHNKRALLSPHGVGTIDQALLSVLNVKHQFVRLWGLGRRTILFDEVHAYDLYTQTLIERLISWLKSLDCDVILLSATLTNDSRQRLASSFGATQVCKSTSYPRITKVQGHTATAETFQVRPTQFLLRTCAAELEGLSQHLVQLSQAGGAIGCVVNTVSRAQKLYQMVKEALPNEKIVLLHSRFPVHLRLKIEDLLNISVGKESTPEQRRLVVIATQVIEQSLDIDFDVMTSDLAPVDLLLQRSGRLHRHAGRSRPGPLSSATLYVAGIQPDGSIPKLTPYGWTFVYSRHILLRSAWLCWSRLEQQVQLPGALQGDDSLVELCYSKAKLPADSEWVEAMTEAELEYQKELEQDGQKAREAQVAEPKRYCKLSQKPKACDDIDVATLSKLPAVTRLGDPSVQILPFVGSDTGKTTVTGRRFYISKTCAGSDAKAWLKETIRVSHQGIVQELIEQGPPKEWKKNALLRNVYPLAFDSGAWKGKRGQLKLSHELGLVIHHKNSGDDSHEPKL